MHTRATQRELASNCRSVTRMSLLAAMLLGITLTSILVFGALASPNGGNIITVCPSGPPECDYKTIHDGVNASTAGDVVLVYPGAYTEHVTLKSGVVLRSSSGPEVTSITAVRGPTIVATDVTSATVQGFGISNRGKTNPTVGLELTDSNLTLSNSIIQGIHGTNGSKSSPDGTSVIAIRFTGTGNMTITNSVVRDIVGGSPCDSCCSRNGGEAIAVWIDAIGRVSISQTSILQLKGGDGSTTECYAYYCEGKGARAVGVHAEGDVDLTVSHSKLSNITGGAPCLTGSPWCVERAGSAFGIEAIGGTVTSRDNLFADISSWAAHASRPSYAIHTSLTYGTFIEDNTMRNLSVREVFPYSVMGRSPLQPQSPCCSPPPGSVVAIASDGDAVLQVTNNFLDDLNAKGSGQAIGIRAHRVADVTISGNSISNISGGSFFDSVGIDIDRANAASIDANRLTRIRGGTSPMFCYFNGAEGGNAVGIKLTSVTNVTVTNSSVCSLTGGRGTSMPPPLDEVFKGQDGGNATALRISGGIASIQNNSFYQTLAGPGGHPGGHPGISAGMVLTENATALISNNVIVSHGIGVSVTSGTISFDHNDLWHNETEYVGTTPGPNDLSVDPVFVNPENCDLHLDASSPLIDVGANAEAPNHDFEGEPRPLDGNDDRSAIVDIGADEYWSGLRGSTKRVSRVIARAGDLLSYQLSIVNPSRLYDLPNVLLTDTIPGELMYVDGSLWASSGTPAQSDGVISWTGTVSANHSVTLTFDTTIGEQFMEPEVLTNCAVLNDRVGVLRTVEATTLVNPLRRYLPLAPVSPPN